MTSRLLESKEDARQEAEHLQTAEVHGASTTAGLSSGARADPSGVNRAASSVENIRTEWERVSVPGLEGGAWTQELGGASPEQAMGLAEGGMTT
ncbi:hypothetical protein CYMTET_3119 [Cymbomonas tetramitiformis]|uniref:Uncharacterized protein n=1 Tax=Cymbomonas tetramitiformis TaxID=36881 RepID=A0AAE0H4C2_9CHLO|nr:hypothetical protein CYMTET_3119 [Cymbomonas tetramitiformis]